MDLKQIIPAGNEKCKRLNLRKSFANTSCVYLLLQAFDSVSVSSLSGALRSLYVFEAGP